ncbi:MAG: hypothetical protein QNJ97_17245 [Myxococcota bacterium]|nr:hypothetical protein [Myxococcota bacterium]
MKTAISIPDPIFNAAEKLARRVGLSRSALYTQAIERFLREHRFSEVTEKLNAVYAETGSDVDQELAEIQLTTLQMEETP